MGRWVCSVKVLTTLDASSMRGTFISSAGVGVFILCVGGGILCVRGSTTLFEEQTGMYRLL